VGVMGSKTIGAKGGNVKKACRFSIQTGEKELNRAIARVENVKGMAGCVQREEEKGPKRPAKFTYRG